MYLHVPGVEGATPVGETVEAAGVTGVVGAWEELSLGVPPEDGVAAADWLRELDEEGREERSRGLLIHGLALSLSFTLF